MADAAIRTHGLSKTYGRTVGIADLDLQVDAGEVFGFLGPNGAGKTTTIRLLLGLIHPTRGSAVVLGHDVASAGRVARRDLGYLPGDLAFDERMSGESLLAYLGRLRGGVPAADYRGLAERFGVDLHRRIGDLSKGNRQKIGVIQAFMHRPRLLVLDEPTSGLDPLVQVEFAALVRETLERGATVFLSSHVLVEVEQLADRVGIVSEGRLIAVESVDGLRERAARRVEMDFPVTAPPQLAAVPGVTEVSRRGGTVQLMVTGPLTQLLKVAVDHGVVDVHTHDPDLEDAFLHLVGPGSATSTSGGTP